MTTATATPPRVKLMTADEFYDWCNRPENADRRFELVRGKVIEVPPPTKIHGVVSANIAYVLGGYMRQRQAGYITTGDAGTLIERDPDTVRGPDVAYFTDANSFKELHPKYGEHPPVLAVEVLSPNDRINRVLSKIDDYTNNGVRLVWLVDPEDKSVRVFRAGASPVTLTGDDVIDGGDALPDFRCPLNEFFRLPKDLINQTPASNAPPAS
jgi:Uma2 family endonuclease